MLKYCFLKIVIEWQDETSKQKLEWRKEHMQGRDQICQGR